MKKYVVYYGKNKYLKVNDLDEKFFLKFDNEVVEGIYEATQFDDISKASFFNERTTYKKQKGIIKKVV